MKQRARTRIVNLLPTEKNLCQNVALVVRRVKVCKNAKGCMTLAIAEHEIWWEETLVLDHCGGQKLDLKEALHFR